MKMKRERPFVSQLVSDTKIPRMFKIKQHFSRPKINIEEIPSIIQQQLSADKFTSKIKPNMRIVYNSNYRQINLPAKLNRICV